MLLRNDWHRENNLVGLQPVPTHGAVPGAARDGRIAAATQADDAAPAAAVLTNPATAAAFKIAGDTPSRSPNAPPRSSASPQPIVYQDLPEANDRAALPGDAG